MEWNFGVIPRPSFTVKLKFLSFWPKLIDEKQSKLSSLIYRLLFLKTHGNNTFSWINFVKSILDDCGYSNVWHTQNFIRHKWLIESTKLRLTDQFKQNFGHCNTQWNSSPISQDWHSWHSLLCLSTFVQRPTLIGNLWLDVLNLQKVNLFLSFNTSKYFSDLKFDLNNL
jgi:hypothetical protein